MLPGDPSAYKTRKPRSLTASDLEAFDKAANERVGVKKDPLPTQQSGRTFHYRYALETPEDRWAFMQWVAARNARRLKRIGEDLDWLRLMAHQWGANPDDIKHLM